MYLIKNIAYRLQMKNLNFENQVNKFILKQKKFHQHI